MRDPVETQKQRRTTIESNSTTSTETTTTTVYRHHKRPAWGMAVFLWERDGKRGYQFEDGQQRVFKDGYFHLLKPEQAVADTPAARALVRMAARNNAGQTTKGAAPLPRVADQIGLFMAQYPEGFLGKAWRTEHRGHGARRVLKRHRDPVVKLAREQLDRERMAEAIELGRFAEVRNAATKVLRATDLVSKKVADQFGALEATEKLAMAIWELLFDDTEHRIRLDRFVRVLTQQGIKPSWTLATVLPALRFPTDHLCVRPSVLKVQARMVAPRFKPDAAPSGRSYLKYLEVVAEVQRELSAAGRRPADLLDVAQFVFLTLRPSARERLAGAGDAILSVH